MPHKIKIQTLNNISPKGLERFPLDRYEVASEIIEPHAIMLRSYNMHDMALPESLLAVGRAGAGVNNIPVERLTRMGVPVFNAPGANANAVKELVIAGMLLAARNICQAWDYTRGLSGDAEAMHRAVEDGKKQFVGFELAGKTLGVIGLGAIGVKVANAALELGMEVIGYDPTITVERAWKLSSEVMAATTADELLQQVDFVTFHVPLVDTTRHLLNAERLSAMREGAVVVNFAREGIVDNDAVLAALDAGRLHAYVCDFPAPALQGNPRVIALPHLGASTREAEENCAVMVADELRAYLEDGNVYNSVNFPTVRLPRSGQARIAIANENRPDMVGQISRTLGESGLNIDHMINESRGDIAYTLVDVDEPVPQAVAEALCGIDGVLKVRVL